VPEDRRRWTIVLVAVLLVAGAAFVVRGLRDAGDDETAAA
jgi:hypothetical protein